MTIQTLHTQAMDFAEEAALHRARGKHRAAATLLAQAMEKEKEAALMAVSEGAPEPTRSILLQSAANLAFDCGELRMGEQLVGHALSGDPPPEIAAELRSVLAQKFGPRKMRQP